MLRLMIPVAVALLGGLAPAASAAAEDDQSRARERMVREIEADVARTSSYLDTEALDPRVMAALGRVPRHEYVPDDVRR